MIVSTLLPSIGIVYFTAAYHHTKAPSSTLHVELLLQTYQLAAREI